MRREVNIYGSESIRNGKDGGHKGRATWRKDAMQPKSPGKSTAMQIKARSLAQCGTVFSMVHQSLTQKKKKKKKKTKYATRSEWWRRCQLL